MAGKCLSLPSLFQVPQPHLLIFFRRGSLCSIRCDSQTIHLVGVLPSSDHAPIRNASQTQATAMGLEELPAIGGQGDGATDFDLPVFSRLQVTDRQNIAPSDQNLA